MEILHQLVSLVAALMGMSPEGVVALVFGLASAPVTVILTTKMKSFFDAQGWFPGEIAGKISGVVMVLASGAIAFLVTLVVGWLFGINFFASEASWQGIAGSLGINQTTAQLIYHWKKGKQAGN